MLLNLIFSLFCQNVTTPLCSDILFVTHYSKTIWHTFPHFRQILILEIIEKSLYSAFPAIHVHQGDQAQEVWNNGQDADVMFFWYIQTFLNECATSSP